MKIAINMKQKRVWACGDPKEIAAWIQNRFELMRRPSPIILIRDELRVDLAGWDLDWCPST